MINLLITKSLLRLSYLTQCNDWWPSHRTTFPFLLLFIQNISPFPISSIPDWLILHNQRALTIFGRWEQIYIWLETRFFYGIFYWKQGCIDQSPFSGAATWLFIHEWTKKWRLQLSKDKKAESLSKTERKKYKNIQNIIARWLLSTLI